MRGEDKEKSETDVLDDSEARCSGFLFVVNYQKHDIERPGVC